jgi:hypothetical protein
VLPTIISSLFSLSLANFLGKPHGFATHLKNTYNYFKMGNAESDPFENEHNFKYENYGEKRDSVYLHKVTIEGLDYLTVGNLVRSLQLPERDARNILNMLQFFKDNEEKFEVSNMRSILFDRGSLPLLEIENLKVQPRKKNEKDTEGKYFSLRVNISDFFKREKN